jgi:hypothetical protein
VTTVGIYATNYFDWEPPRPQASPITVITHLTHPIEIGDPRISGISWWKPAPGTGRGHTPSDLFHGRVAAAWWGHHPELALPSVDVTVHIGGNFTIHIPDLAERCLAELGDDDLLLMRHPWRDDIVDEAEASRLNWKWNTQPMAAQVASYLAAGHPRHWGLFHGGFMVRRDTPAVREFNAALEAEYRRWTSQNQLSLPHLIRTSGLRWHAWPDVGQWHSLPFAEGWFTWGDLGR